MLVKAFDDQIGPELVFQSSFDEGNHASG
jgi:hypothetical protein